VLSIVHAKFCAGSIRLMPGEDRVRPASTASSVEFRHATKRYRGQPDAALGDFSLKVEAGEICVLVGPSGCGKTTALRLVNRMIELSGGDILIDDVSIRTRPAAELRRGIGYVIQQIGLFPHLTIGDNVGVVPRPLAGTARGPPAGWRRCSTSCRCPPTCVIASPLSSPAVSASGSAWRARSQPIRR
jgi:hypothetical protein